MITAYIFDFTQSGWDVDGYTLMHNGKQIPVEVNADDHLDAEEVAMYLPELACGGGVYQDLFAFQYWSPHCDKKWYSEAEYIISKTSKDEMLKALDGKPWVALQV
ncbi:hypothetical protein ACQKPX_24755 [Photobacterium sp. DNB23_23_1]